MEGGRWTIQAAEVGEKRQEAMRTTGGSGERGMGHASHRGQEDRK